MEVPFNRPYVPESSARALSASLVSGHLSGDGPMTRKVQEMAKAITGESELLLTPSCTHALELACRLANLGPGDEVILPSFTFPSAATAVALTGALPVFVDSNSVTRSPAVHQYREAITSRTRAIITLHYGGIMKDQVAMRKLANDYCLLLIEDSAHAFGVHGTEAMAGSVGDFAVYSFHETKNIQCGEGGALQINNSEYVERAQVLREKGTNRAKFREGLVDKYTWIDHGSSWLLADPLAAVLLGQLEKHELIQEARRRIFERYERGLATWSQVTGFQIDKSPSQQENAAHIFVILAPNLDLRNALLKHLRGRGVGATFHYQTLHDAPAGKKFGRTHGEVTVGKKLSETVIRLPFFVELTPEEQDYVIRSVREFLPAGQQGHEA